jgi:hypothetical protein
LVGEFDLVWMAGRRDLFDCDIANMHADIGGSTVARKSSPTSRE